MNSLLHNMNTLKSQIASLQRTQSVLSQQVAQLAQRVRVSRLNEVSILNGLLSCLTYVEQIHMQNVGLADQRQELVRLALCRIINGLNVASDYETAIGAVNSNLSGTSDWETLTTEGYSSGVINRPEVEGLRASINSALSDVLTKAKQSLEKPMMPTIKSPVHPQVQGPQQEAEVAKAAPPTPAA